jgi:hypothetical protein
MRNRSDETFSIKQHTFGSWSAFAYVLALQKRGYLMDAGTTKDYLEDLIQQVNKLEVQFRTLNAVIVQLQEERDNFRALWIAEKQRHR